MKERDIAYWAIVAVDNFDGQMDLELYKLDLNGRHHRIHVWHDIIGSDLDQISLSLRRDFLADLRVVLDRRA